MTLDTSLLFRLNPEKAAEVYQKIGPEFVEVVVEPNIRSVTAARSASALYTGGRADRGPARVAALSAGANAEERKKF